MEAHPFKASAAKEMYRLGVVHVFSYFQSLAIFIWLLVDRLPWLCSCLFIHRKSDRTYPNFKSIQYQMSRHSSCHGSSTCSQEERQEKWNVILPPWNTFELLGIRALQIPNNSNISCNINKPSANFARFPTLFPTTIISAVDPRKSHFSL